MSVGLRERKKERTRAAISEAAGRLFLRRGYEETTIAEIAAAADVSPRTFFSYFPNKEEAIFCDFRTDLESLRERMQKRPEGEGAIEALRGWVMELIADTEFNDDAKLEHRRLIRETPALTAYEVSHIDPEFRAILAAGVATDVGQQPEDLAPQMIAASASAALRTLGDFLVDHEATADVERLLGEAIDFLESGLEYLERG